MTWMCCGVSDDLQQRMYKVLQRYGVRPRELSEQQLYRLALILQLTQADNTAGIQVFLCLHP